MNEKNLLTILFVCLYDFSGLLAVDLHVNGSVANGSDNWKSGVGVEMLLPNVHTAHFGEKYRLKKQYLCLYQSCK